MISRIVTSAIVAVAFAVVAACGASSKNSSPVSPSQSASVDSFVGGWASTASAGTVGPQSCTKLNYNITKTGSNSASVSYDATCDGYDVKGTGQGSVTGSVLTWSASGTVAGNGISCPFEFKDNTATPQGSDALLVTYHVTICYVGPISGTQVVQRTR